MLEEAADDFPSEQAGKVRPRGARLRLHQAAREGVVDALQFRVDRF